MWETVLKPPKPSALLGVRSPQLEESHTLHLCIWWRTAQRLTPALLFIVLTEPVCGMPQANKVGRNPGAVRARKRPKPAHKGKPWPAAHRNKASRGASVCTAPDL